MPDTQFSELALSKPIQSALIVAGYRSPTPIQEQAIPLLLKGRDLLGIAQTGTGKTAAFSLPILDALARDGARAKPRKPLGLVLAPTRELAVQIAEELEKFGCYTKTRTTLVFGGVGQGRQVEALKKGTELVIATPGRLLDLAGQGAIDLSAVSYLVLDEADRLLDMGFIKDVKKIVAQTPRARQSLLFSATMPAAVKQLAEAILKQPARVEVTPEQVTVERIEQYIVPVAGADKRKAMAALFRLPEVKKAIVFTRTKHGADKVARQLKADGIEAVALHGNKSQNARQRALAQFKGGEAWALVATDIAARGIDIDGVSHVFNHELPHEPESYVHRIGRTGRNGADGVAWTLVDPAEQPRLKQVERFIKLQLPTARLDFEASVDGTLVQATVATGAKAGSKPESKAGAGEAKRHPRQKQHQANQSNGGRRRRRSNAHNNTAATHGTR